MIKTIWWEDNRVHLLDQRALPAEERYVACRDYREVIRGIRDLTIRGAPAIGVAAALGIALGMRACTEEEDREGQFNEICAAFARARPTARNLFWAIERMRACYERLKGAPLREKQETLLREAQTILEEDLANNIRLGRYGEALLADGSRIMTYCNAGALATAGYGTALGIIRAAYEAGKSVHVYACETRPVLQGARLTAWELRREGIDVTLITDNMAGYVMSQGKVDGVIVGADRIAANGDTANKIGTYSLAVLARENGIPFYVAAPASTLDAESREGKDIIIEERPPDEVTSFLGIRSAPAGIRVYNPAFDVTPHRYITAIVTEHGVIRPDFRQNLASLGKK